MACEKDEKRPQLDGTYAGTFRTLVNTKEKSTEFQVTLNSRRFTTEKGGTGRGAFEIGDRNFITFADELFYTANFDWNTLLTGDYRYEQKGDSLILDKVFISPANGVPGIYYQYRLKKI